ncbi:MAG: phenylalanyl-tRNA synthetase beta chain [Thermoleophilaceae bacterium]|jgi:phenylalanyl-tRNA synthetase beta chain|nr:phenylalanyl-tRNA synthetase beta chain [Thermoleophilaceae bacterium]
MRVPVSWLREYCDPDLSTAEIAERFDLTGTEVARIERAGVGAPEGFVVGRVLEAERHPDADRLTVCRVDVGAGEPETIVCGAPNVAAGQSVAVARPGAVMPDGTVLGRAKLRGVESSGMILAEDEVGISDAHAEIMVLDGDAAPGEPLAAHLPIADEVIELEITPNRPDCLGVYGIARELHAATGAPLADDPADADAEAAGDDTAEDHASVEIADPDICLRFTARVFEGVEVGPSPLWLKQRLTAAGQRPISNVVDITNYVMLLTGQPVHAFDLDEVRGRRIVVRRARPGETMTTLDGVERRLDPEMAMVCDAEGPSGIAGVMGGQISEVSETTTRVLMEMATWVGPNILETSKRLGLRSEASARFEKQLHPDQAISAQRVAARLMVELCGARMVPGTIDVYPKPVEPRIVCLRNARLEKLLGESISIADSRSILLALGFDVPGEDGCMPVGVPGFRHSDVEREVDLIEEVARIYGLEKLPTTLPARERAVGRLTHEQRLRRRAEDALRDRGLFEVVAWSFTAPETIERLRLGDDVPLLRLSNPLSEDQSVMRPLLLPGLLDAARRNAAYDRPGASYFESAHVYRPSGPLDAPEGSPGGRIPAAERHHLAALVPGDFFAAKGVLEGLLETLRVPFTPEPGDRPFLHPGRAASVLAGDERKVGWIGELHPLVAREWDLPGGSAFELDIETVAEIAEGTAGYRPVSTFPAVVQDIAVVVDEQLPAAHVERAVTGAGGELLDRVRLFDVYRGEQVGEGHKSIALRLEFRAPDRTLTDDEIAAVRDEIERALGEIGGKLRG